MKREEFLKLTLAGVGALAVPTTWAAGLDDVDCAARKIKNYGIQVWSVRDAMEKDAKGTLKLLSEYGYNYIESFKGSKGLWWGMTPADFKSYCNDLGMQLKSVHCNPDDNYATAVKEASSIGIEYMIYAWEGNNKTLEDYKKMAPEFNKHGQLCKDNGIKFAFHNHDYTFELRGGEYGQDVLMKNTDANLVDFQMDIYWVVAAGQDPITWIKKYPNRFKLCHVKERAIGATDKSASCILGTGSIDFKKILKTAKKHGMEYYMVEQEKYDQGTSMYCAEQNAKYMNKFRF